MFEVQGSIRMRNVKDQETVGRDQSRRASEIRASEIRAARLQNEREEKNYRAAGLQNDGNSGDATD